MPRPWGETYTKKLLPGVAVANPGLWLYGPARAHSQSPCFGTRLMWRKKAILDIWSSTNSVWYVLQIKAGVAPAFLELINSRTSTLFSQSFFGFGQSAEVEIALANSENRKQVDVKNEDGKKEKLFLYYDGETVAGKVRTVTNT